MMNHHHHRGGRREENGGTTGPDGDNETPASALESAGPAAVPSRPMSPSKKPYDDDDDNDDNYDEDDDDDSDDDDDRNGFSPPQDAKAAIVKYVTVRNTLRPVPAKSDTAGKSGDPGKLVGAQKFQFDVPNGLISEDMLEELRKQHPAAHILTSIAAQVSATQAQSADDASRALGLAYNGTNIAFGDGALQDRKYGAISGSFSDAGELMLAGSAGEGASDPTTDDAQVVDCASEEREVPSASSEMAPCLVCGDRGSGFHYSIFSCEGCKGFFKRTVQKNMVYACKDSGSCFINKTTRNNCQACRFKKCIDVGMKKEAVREDRTPGGKHRLKRPRMEEPPAMAAAVGVSGLDADTITKLIEARPDMVPTIEELAIGSQTEELDVDDLMHFGYLELRFIIEWAKKVPGFSDLVLEDQMALLKSSFMELNLLRLAYRSLDCPGSIKFANEVILSAMQCVHLGWGHDLLNCILEFVTRLRNINIDNTEFCVLNAVVLTYPDAVGIVDKPSVVSLQSQMLNCLQTYSLTRYPNELRRFGLILLRLPALRTISAKAAEMFLSLSLEGNVKMNALVIEMMQ